MGAQHVSAQQWHCSLATSCIEGLIMEERRGTGGFGYDSIFMPTEGDGRTFAQMSAIEKNAISHRGRAVSQLVAHLTKMELWG